MAIQNRDYTQIADAPTFKLVLYKVKIDQVWLTESKVLGELEFKFAWQTSWWDDKTDLRNGIDPADKRVIAFNNYYRANIFDDVTIHATFTDYDPKLFRAVVPRRTRPDIIGHLDLDAMMSLEYMRIEEIVESSYSFEFKRQVYKDQISIER